MPYSTGIAVFPSGLHAGIALAAQLLRLFSLSIAMAGHSPYLFYYYRQLSVRSNVIKTLRLYFPEWISQRQPSRDYYDL